MDPLTWLRTTVKNAEEHGNNVVTLPVSRLEWLLESIELPAPARVEIAWRDGVDKSLVVEKRDAPFTPPNPADVNR